MTSTWTFNKMLQPLIKNIVNVCWCEIVPLSHKKKETLWLNCISVCVLVYEKFNSNTISPQPICLHFKSKKLYNFFFGFGFASQFILINKHLEYVLIITKSNNFRTWICCFCKDVWGVCFISIMDTFCCLYYDKWNCFDEGMKYNYH